MTLSFPVPPSDAQSAPSSPPTKRAKLQNYPTQPRASESSPVSPTTVPSYPSPASMDNLSVPQSESSPTQHQETSGRQFAVPAVRRRESFHFSGERPHPPAAGANHSLSGPMPTVRLLGTPSDKGSPALSSRLPTVDKEELTTKGRKRKRLAKACSACHKNKRRCDGFAPCSNCEFSNRPCQYVNAQGEPIPPPRTRDSSASVPLKKDGSKSGSNETSSISLGHERKASGESSHSQQGMGDPEYEMRRKPSVGPLQIVEMDISLSAELVDIFFKRCLPLPIILHLPTFNYRLYLNQVSPVLLDVIYAFAARLCENPIFLQTLSPNHLPHHRGELFALRAHRNAESLIHQRKKFSEEARRADRGSWQETELAQTAYLLSVYFTCTRQAKLGLFYLEAGIDILRPSPVPYIQPPAAHPGSNPVEFTTHMETRNRTFWALVLHDLCASTNGRPRKLTEADLGTIPLPGSETQWARWGGSGPNGREPGRRDGLVPGTGSWSDEEGSVGEVGHVIRILSILADIMALATDSSSGESKQVFALRLEGALKNWAMSLPRHMHFNESNLTHALGKLASQVPEAKTSGWMYAYMHAAAECGMFYLQAAVAPASDSVVTARRQSQAIENLIVIMDTIGLAGREGSCFVFPLFVISNWQDHLEKSEFLIRDVKHHLTEERLNLWWAEKIREWGIDQHEVLQRGFYALPFPSTASSPSFHQTRMPSVETPSSLGLYQTSPRGRASIYSVTAISPSSSAVNSTPLFSGNPRLSLPSLPPFRPRATSGASTMSYHGGRSPSPPHHLPYVNTSSDRERDSVTLPPLSVGLSSFREPPSPRHPLSQSISSRYLPKSHPYVRERSQSPRETGRHGEGMSGIAALVSVAEREREKEIAKEGRS
ncbi:hypothetical protein L198_03831 [Cryptococcus wingfieldii CBS 7118]|uniref:Zn(2)-C6 fungal-type domain-containing protein n=1 Tax=Cryptococcus wingfieldii CBS 7118 TaxID=1295528 RepID=A0A1E3J8S1_9TREE|nr:hypothetical protein L198_03831 [Cryptococcus wingfieldii CBS 7118]ODN97268.1 hypothetical protein L198_03831 [Cryptococcus wingfieldii CBS 7118]